MSLTPPNDSELNSPNETKPITADRATYNVVSDMVTGLNVRKSDNKLQAIFIFVSLLIFAAIFAFLALINPGWNLPWYGGAVVGAFLGLVFGFFTSGIFLMVFRAIRHMQGKHD
jgi:hypothetical protein